MLSISLLSFRFVQYSCLLKAFLNVFRLSRPHDQTPSIMAEMVRKLLFTTQIPGLLSREMMNKRSPSLTQLFTSTVHLLKVTQGFYCFLRRKLHILSTGSYLFCHMTQPWVSPGVIATNQPLWMLPYWRMEPEWAFPSQTGTLHLCPLLPFKQTTIVNRNLMTAMLSPRMGSEGTAVIWVKSLW